MEFVPQTNDPNYLQTTSKRLVHPFKAFNELIDNSLDAGASAISIEQCAPYMRFTDNGSGCVAQGLHTMMSFGKSEQNKNRIGRYGEVPTK